MSALAENRPAFTKGDKVVTGGEGAAIVEHLTVIAEDDGMVFCKTVKDAHHRIYAVSDLRRS